jgi:predicted dehydrogenase
MRKCPEVELAVVCDVYDKNAASARESLGGKCPAHRDFRRVLDDKTIDAVLVATPDHWHATMAVLACQAGKDVYVEKPLAHNVREGRAVVMAARRHNRIVQVGTQHRSAAHYREVQAIVQRGELGPVHFVRIWNFMNRYPAGMGRAADSPTPDGLDWEMYLGPAPLVPFNKNRFLGTFRWFFDYAGGLITDWGTHRFDSLHQVMGVTAPVNVSAVGRRYELSDGGETPDMLQVTYEYPNFIVSYEACQLNAHGAGGRTPGKSYYRARGKHDRPHGEAYYGPKGTLFVDRVGYETYPEMEPGARPTSGSPGFRMARKEAAGEDATTQHVRNFVDCVRSRQQPAADAETGHTSTNVAHLGNIAFRTGQKLRWDAAKEEFPDNAAANELLRRVPRKPWDVI